MIPKEIISALQSYWKTNGLNTQILNTSSLGGGSINRAYMVETSSGAFFIKVNTAQAHPQMFASEFKGLELMASTHSIRIPKPLHFYEGIVYSCIVLEYIEQKGQRVDFWQQFSQGLAKMHQQSAKSFGLPFDNFMGSLPQSNTSHDNFVDFFIAERLEPQLEMALNDGYLKSSHLRKAENLYKELPAIFPEEKPALVHGDLWSGNFMSDENGESVIMDPATYFGHREVDIAMTTMFGGFSSEFYQYYQQAFPMEKGWEQRLPYYKLYPILIHINLFGSSYLGSFERVIDKF